MTSLLCATLIHAAILTAGADPAAAAETYAEAHRTTTQTGMPLVVMVSTDWCMPCQMMKRTVLPRVRERGLLRKVAFAMVNPDRERDLAEKLTGGGPIPQLVMFRKTAGGWVRDKLIGGQSVETVEEFISAGVAQSEADKGPGGTGNKKSQRDELRGNDTTVAKTGTQHG